MIEPRPMALAEGDPHLIPPRKGRKAFAARASFRVEERVCA